METAPKHAKVKVNDTHTHINMFKKNSIIVLDPLASQIPLWPFLKMDAAFAFLQSSWSSSCPLSLFEDGRGWLHHDTGYDIDSNRCKRNHAVKALKKYELLVIETTATY